MKERVAALVGDRARLMWVSTFHSACVRILRAEHEHAGLKSTFSIYDADDSRRLMQLVGARARPRPEAVPGPQAGRPGLQPEERADRRRARPRPTPRARTSARSPRRTRSTSGGCEEAHALDFDDLIMTTVHLLQAHPEVAEHYRRRFRHVLVDEYQDTNHAQYTLVKELVGRRTGELCVVGDADQSIYAFRGATIRNILEFERDYPDARTILLEQNYRSTQTILTAANAVIDRNTERKPKNLWSDQGAGEQIVGYVADTEHAEADWVAREIDRLADAGEARPGDVAVFYRTNAQSRVFEEIFIRLGLPYKVVGGVRFYERKEVRDALAYLRAIANADDTVSVRRILNTPAPRASATGPRHASRRSSSRERISFGAALRRAERGAGHAAAGGRRDRRLRRAARRAARDERGRPARGGPGGGAAPLGLPRRAGGEHRPAGRGPGRQPPGAGQRGPRVHRAGRGRSRARRTRPADPGRLPGAGLAGRRRRPDPVRRPRPRRAWSR